MVLSPISKSNKIRYLTWTCTGWFYDFVLGDQDLIPEILKTRTIEWFILSTFLSCWEHFKSKDAKPCVLKLFETMFWNSELLWFYLNRRKKKMLFICQILKTRTLNCAFWRYSKQYFGTFDNQNRFFFSLTRLKTRTLNAKLCIRTVFKTMFWNCWEHLETEDTWNHFGAIWKMELLRNLWSHGR